MPTTDCILWEGARDKDDYGVATKRGGTTRAHRQAYADAYGPIPDGLNILHRCDNPPCINVAHLWAGTQKENIHDRDRKGRRRGGQLGTLPREITADLVVTVRSLLSEGRYQKDIAEAVGLHQSTVSRIANGQRWYGGVS